MAGTETSLNENSKATELLNSFHEQFAENQNHHQTVFIQFISAVIVVIVGYAIVYTNTEQNADFYFAKKAGHDIESYAIIHLIGSFLTAANILGLVSVLTINIGYGFRRDQKVNYNIRMQYLGEAKYMEIFGDKSFNPTGKSFWKYLPEFNMIFTASIVIIQLYLIFSVFYALQHFKDFAINLLENPISQGLLILFIVAPVVCTILFYKRYYTKYCNVTNTQPYYTLKKSNKEKKLEK
jgi:hypothetical protein